MNISSHNHIDAHAHTFQQSDWWKNKLTCGCTYACNLVYSKCTNTFIGSEYGKKLQNQPPETYILVLVLSLDGCVIWDLRVPTGKMSNCGGKKNKLNDLKSLYLTLWLQSDPLGRGWAQAWVHLRSSLVSLTCRRQDLIPWLRQCFCSKLNCSLVALQKILELLQLHCVRAM